MTPLTLQIIADEHRSLSSMLHSLTLMVQRPSDQVNAGDFEVMRAMLLYILEFPEKLHHAKESHYLFPMVASRSEAVKEVIAELDRQHAQGENKALHLLQRLVAWEMLGKARQKEFLDAVTEYLDFYLEHMRLETEIILPEAVKVLSEQDWAFLDDQFRANRDPLTGHVPAIQYEKLFRFILYNAPEPIGLGRLHGY